MAAIINEQLSEQFNVEQNKIVVIDGLTFAELRFANMMREREWDPDNVLTLEFKGNELGGECGEAQNIIKKLARARLGIPATMEDLAKELADVVICADLIAMTIGADLGKAVREKFNASSDKLELAARIRNEASSRA